MENGRYKMEKDIPLKIEILTSGKDDQYRLTAAREIEFILHNLVRSNSPIALYYSENDDSIMTTLLNVDSTGLWLHQTQNPLINDRLMESDKLIFVSSHAQVKVQFVSDGAAPTSYQGQAAFFLELPDSLYRLQRREYFRLITPVANPLRCVIPSATTVKHNPHEVTIMDISGGGVGLTCAELDSVLIPGHIYENCKIDLLDTGEFIGTIEVKNLVVLSTPDGQTVRRSGCEW